jgi:hypothetical protein
MNKPSRRNFLKLLGGSAALAAAHGPLMRAFAEADSDQYFIFIHASGGWDVTLWSDPRNEMAGLVEPASTDNTDITGLKNWKSKPLVSTEIDADTFELVKPAGSNITFGPAIGELVKHYDKICLFNGVEMNTVSHPDGTVFSATGRHLSGGRATQSSIDTVVANELGLLRPLPLVSVRFPSWYVGRELDPRAIPIRIGSVAQVASSLNRSTAYEQPSDREAVTMLLAEEAQELALQSHIPDSMEAMALQYKTLQQMLGGPVKDVFDQNKLKALQPDLSPDLKNANGTYFFPFYRTSVLNASFAIEAMKQNLVRCVSFSLGGIDTHNANYEDHALRLQEIFTIISRMVDSLEVEGLLAKTHIFVFSDFCRTPQINITKGRDHYPNNSALVISPRLKGNTVFGATDAEQLLPKAVDGFSDGPRPVTPPDILATLLAGVGIEERKYLREGEVIEELIV